MKMTATAAAAALAELESYCIEACPQAKEHPVVGRRCVRVGVMELAKDPTMDADELKSAIRTRYKLVYGNPILVAILLQIMVSIVAKLIADWLIKWWEKRKKEEEEEKDPETEVRGFLAMMASAAQVAVDSDQD